jgi:hypothetical protein
LANSAFGQLVNSVELAEKLEVSTEEAAKKELLHLATLKSIEKLVPELGYKSEEFNEKLNSTFREYFHQYKEKKIIEKFGKSYKDSLSQSELASFTSKLEEERHAVFVRYSHTLEILKSHSFALIEQDKNDNLSWKAKVNLDIDRIKLDKLLRKIIKGEKKPFTKLIIITEIDPAGFSWTDLGLENEKKFINPLNASWLKWLNDNIPSTVEEVVVCDSDCTNYFTKWSGQHPDDVSVPEEYSSSVFLKTNILLKRSSVLDNVQEVTFEWEGRAVLHDLATKRILASFALPPERRTFRQLDQKALNSGIASSLYRSPLTAFMQFNRKLEQKIGFNRVSKLVIKGHRHVGEVYLLIEMLKTRGSSLGFEVELDSISKEEANLLCFYQGEEKSFTDLLSSIKELKSSHSYTLVNEFTGVHHVIKFVSE